MVHPRNAPSKRSPSLLHAPFPTLECTHAPPLPVLFFSSFRCESHARRARAVDELRERPRGGTPRAKRGQATEGTSKEPQRAGHAARKGGRMKGTQKSHGRRQNIAKRSARTQKVTSRRKTQKGAVAERKSVKRIHARGEVQATLPPANRAGGAGASRVETSHKGCVATGKPLERCAARHTRKAKKRGVNGGPRKKTETAECTGGCENKRKRKRRRGKTNKRAGRRSGCEGLSDTLWHSSAFWPFPCPPPTPISSPAACTHGAVRGSLLNVPSCPHTPLA